MTLKRESRFYCHVLTKISLLSYYCIIFVYVLTLNFYLTPITE